MGVYIMDGGGPSLPPMVGCDYHGMTPHHRSLDCAGNIIVLEGPQAGVILNLKYGDFAAVEEKNDVGMLDDFDDFLDDIDDEFSGGQYVAPDESPSKGPHTGAAAIPEEEQEIRMDEDLLVEREV